MATADLVGNPLGAAVLARDAGECRRLLEDGVPVDSVYGPYQQPALLLAARYGLAEIVALLLEKGASVDKTDNSGGSPLFCAAGRGHAAVVAVLLENGAEIDKTNAEGQTPLSVAAANYYIEIAAMLLEEGANANHADKWSTTPLLTAAQNGAAAVVTLLLQHGAHCDVALHYAARYWCVPCVRTLLAAMLPGGIAAEMRCHVA